jgi:hypothetical protein
MQTDLLPRIKTHLRDQSIVQRFPTAPPILVANAERKIGISLPLLLKQCYLEIANGGFGPGLGIIGIGEGHISDYGDLVSTYLTLQHDAASGQKNVEPGVLPFCAWGCAMLTCVRCDNSQQILTFEEGLLWPQQYTLDGFCELWLAGKDILASDPGVRYADVTFINPFTRAPQTTKVRRRHYED